MQACTVYVQIGYIGSHAGSSQISAIKDTLTYSMQHGPPPASHDYNYICDIIYILNGWGQFPLTIVESGSAHFFAI